MQHSQKLYWIQLNDSTYDTVIDYEEYIYSPITIYKCVVYSKLTVRNATHTKAVLSSQNICSAHQSTYTVNILIVLSTIWLFCISLCNFAAHATARYNTQAVTILLIVNDCHMYCHWLWLFQLNSIGKYNAANDWNWLSVFEVNIQQTQF